MAEDNYLTLTLKGKANLNCDQELLQRALANLISNAIKYSKPGGEVCVELQETSQEVIISVKDDGEGINSQLLDRMGERFFRPNKNKAGTGLGLSIVKSICKLHQGVMAVVSEPRVGTTIFLTLAKLKIETG